MSIYAEAIKKLKEDKNRKEKGKFSFELPGISFFTLTIFLIFIIANFLVVYPRYNNFKTLKRKRREYNIGKYEKKFQDEKKILNEKENEYSENNFKFLYALNNFRKLKRLLLNLNSSTFLYQKYMGLIEYKNGNYSEAKNFLLNALFLKKNDKDVLAYLGLIEFKEGNYEKSLEYFDKIGEESFEIALDRAIILENLHHYSEAISDYITAYHYKIADPLLTFRIKMKIFLLKRYLRKINE